MDLDIPMSIFNSTFGCEFPFTPNDDDQKTGPEYHQEPLFSTQGKPWPYFWRGGGAAMDLYEIFE